MPKTAFPYPGGKYYHANWIVDHLPDHRCYVEPFGGAGTVLMNKDRSYVEVYNDINEDVVHFFRTVREYPEELREWLRTTPFSRQVHDEIADEYFADSRPEDDVERAGKFFYLRFTQFAGKIATKSGFRATNGEGDVSHARRYRTGCGRISEIVDRFGDVILECRDYSDVMEHYDGPETVFYLDPPYVGTENYYGMEFDHEEFVETITELNGRWLLSYEELPELLPVDELWMVEKETGRVMPASSGKHRDATERLVMNFDPDQTPSFSEANQSTIAAYKSG